MNSACLRLFPLFLAVLLTTRPANSQKAAIFNYTIEIELTNDQGDLPTRDYLKNYGTKGKKQAVENMYGTINPFLIKMFEKARYTILALDTLSSVKGNEYGFPAASLAKVVTSGIADQYIRIHIKDISQLSLEGVNQSDPFQRQTKIVKMRCRIQVYDSGKKVVKDAEGVFHTGERIENPAELGIDLRRFEGSDYLQEMKIYETCTKMAVVRAIGSLAGQ